MHEVLTHNAFFSCCFCCKRNKKFSILISLDFCIYDPLKPQTLWQKFNPLPVIESSWNLSNRFIFESRTMHYSYILYQHLFPDQTTPFFLFKKLIFFSKFQKLLITISLKIEREFQNWIKWKFELASKLNNVQEVLKKKIIGLYWTRNFFWI